MKGLSSLFVLAGLIGAAQTLAAAAAAASAATVASTQPTYVGCYSTSGSMNQSAENEFQSRGSCRSTCVDDAGTNDNGNGYAVMSMTKGTWCYCGNFLPNSVFKVDDSKCKQPCGGFSQETCGSRLGEYFSVYTTGLEQSPDEDPAPSSSSASKSSTSSKESSTSATTSTGSEATTTSADSGNKSVNKAGVAVGAVIGVLAIIGIGVGVFVFMRKRRRQQVEEDYRRSAAVRGFTQKPALDTRLDPVMAQRRDSVGSIADNQDYSRKILRVTNPDG
ncbi:hypothetical protein FN846DRAFT_409786 [Sphaerosporella brunnea]|uniref:WSC domain-containing protein n=1 Tax=Sphaerosporella brunnea TaxID=1250544 RepID=A0A5J5EHA5_9PEZI|nr:hypothetical protein FN846DRAFT_409786 [Sphaerosporella brunnea]